MTDPSQRLAGALRPSAPWCSSSLSSQLVVKRSRSLKAGEPPTSVRHKRLARRTILVLTACRDLAGWYSPYPVKDPTADERAVVAGRVYRAVLDEWAQRAMTTPRTGTSRRQNVEARSHLELTERLGPWSLRWQEAQDNAARSRAARYQAMADHLGRMSALEDGRFFARNRPGDRRAGRTEASSRIGRGRTVLPSDR